jgi:hypothetical protein
MKKAKNRQTTFVEPDDMLPEYDLTDKHGMRGKYYQAVQQGHAVQIHENDGSVSVQYFALEDGAVMLDPDVREYFSDSEAVNTTLRALIALIPSKPDRHKAKQRSAAPTSAT